MSKPLSLGLALLFVGLQIATLFHGAVHGFASHSHAAKTLMAFETPALDVFGYERPLDQSDRSPEPFCDLDVFCDKLDKIAVAPRADIQTVALMVDAQMAGHDALISVEWRNAVARGPPSFLPS